ncbi:glycosyl hydrolase family 28-related protein [Coraliomargarita sp. SDUM461004]|uniref:Glycosyl hydrolase family 28-related protein n=1 Tax=Thalassobacterium sedimentorum TaxID=3041258 RepID=A0ABU1AG55_9BACT|nr:glycosyl hydrolase family 28-related protein [Coraliomargarita sp. SDUM461004]MDQ8193770.1 glycosyl hydrolase family 28-related protein [Coraliomargarita sp. SDUM461004]
MLIKILIPALAFIAASFSNLFAAPTVNVRDFGAMGDGLTDDTIAIRAALEASSNIFFPAGTYVLSDGIQLPAGAHIRGEGSPRLGTFPMIEDDKRYLRQGLKDQLPGTTLLFTGKGAQSTILENRSDRFNEVRYALATATKHPFHIEGLAIALDVNVIGSNGRVTKPEDDNRADYDVGLLIDDAGFSTVRDVCVYGFYKKAGLLISTRGIGGNPDYVTFWNCSFMGDVGVALLGDDAPGDRITYGLSGTQFYGCNFFANDHHFRSSEQFGTTAILIDGHTNAKNADINGHYFFGGSVRTYSANAVTLKAASNVVFYGTIFELPKSNWGGIEYGESDNRITGTEDTRDVSFYSCRMHSKGLDELGRSMTNGKLFVVQGHYGDISVQSNGAIARLYANSNKEAIFQLSDKNNSAFTGWNFRFNSDKREQLRLTFDSKEIARFESDGKFIVDSTDTNMQKKDVASSLGATQQVILNDGHISVDSAVVAIDNERGGNALREITGGSENQLLVLKKTPNAATFSITSGRNIYLSESFRMRSATDRLTLIKNDDGWYEISRIGGKN